MITPIRIVMAAGVVLATTLLTTMGHAQDARWQPLRDNERIENGLLTVMIGDFIVQGCDDIEVRRIRSTPFMFGLAREAMGLGFSRTEIEDFIDDPVEKARIEARAEAWLAQNGASRGDAEAVCRVGQAEISAGTTLGGMLRAE